MKEFENIINTAWDNKDSINGQSDKSILDAINQTIELVDKGELRVAEKNGNEWVVNQWVKKAIMLSFRTNDMDSLSGPYSSWYDKSHLLKGKTSGWTKRRSYKSWL